MHQVLRALLELQDHLVPPEPLARLVPQAQQALLVRLDHQALLVRLDQQAHRVLLALLEPPAQLEWMPRLS